MYFSVIDREEGGKAMVCSGKFVDRGWCWISVRRRVSKGVTAVNVHAAYASKRQLENVK